MTPSEPALPLHLKDRWRRAIVSVTSAPNDRTPERLLEVVRQFDVEASPRYQAWPGQTWCNVFVWDVTSAMGAEVPHWVFPDGRPAPVGVGSELNANQVALWLSRAQWLGWSATTSELACVAAGLGEPVVLAWRNPAGHGHLAVGLPTPPGSPLLIAQAGARNFVGRPYTEGFGKVPVSFYLHA